MLTVVGWLWSSATCAAKYKVEHANVWASMIGRNLTIPHRFVLITDQPSGAYDRNIEIVKLWDEWRDLRNPKWNAEKPNCYVRLKAFSEEAREIIGGRFVSIDLDCIVTANLDGLFNRNEDFLIYRRHKETMRDELNTYQGSMWLMTAGSRATVWESFEGAKSVAAAAQYMGTDQAWIRHVLGPDEAGWTQEDGVYSWPNVITDRRYENGPPANARIIFFNGTEKPWSYSCLDAPVCQSCGAVVRVQSPFQIVQKRGFSIPHPWVARFWK